MQSGCSTLRTLCNQTDAKYASAAPTRQSARTRATRNRHGVKSEPAASLSSASTVLAEPHLPSPEHISGLTAGLPTRVVSPDFLRAGTGAARIPPVQQSSMGRLSQLSRPRPTQHAVPQASKHSIQKPKLSSGASYRAVQSCRKGRPQRSAE